MDDWKYLPAAQEAGSVKVTHRLFRVLGLVDLDKAKAALEGDVANSAIRLEQVFDVTIANVKGQVTQKESGHGLAFLAWS